MLDFSDRTRTGISKLISRCALIEEFIQSRITMCVYGHSTCLTYLYDILLIVLSKVAFEYFCILFLFPILIFPIIIFNLFLMVTGGGRDVLYPRSKSPANHYLAEFKCCHFLPLFLMAFFSKKIWEKMGIPK